MKAMTMPISRCAFLAVASASLGLTACNQPADDAAERKADAIEQQSDAVADRMEDQADTMTGAPEDAMENKAESVEEQGEAKADAMEDKADQTREQAEGQAPGQP